MLRFTDYCKGQENRYDPMKLISLNQTTTGFVSVILSFPGNWIAQGCSACSAKSDSNHKEQKHSIQRVL